MCPQSCSNFLKGSDKAIPKSTLLQHFKILREAGLIRSERHGVELQNLSRCTELEGRFPDLIRAILTAHAIQSRDEARAKMATSKRPTKRTATNKTARFKPANSSSRSLRGAQENGKAIPPGKTPLKKAACYFTLSEGISNVPRLQSILSFS